MSHHSHLQNLGNQTTPQILSDQSKSCLFENFIKYLVDIEQVIFTYFLAEEAFIELSAGRIKSDMQ